MTWLTPALSMYFAVGIVMFPSLYEDARDYDDMRTPASTAVVALFVAVVWLPILFLALALVVVDAISAAKRTG